MLGVASNVEGNCRGELLTKAVASCSEKRLILVTDGIECHGI